MINEIIYHHRPTYARRGTAGQSATAVLIEPTATWKFNKQGIDLGTAWREPGYDDSGWAEGPGPLGFETPDAVLPEPFGTDFLQSDGQWTYYFRKRFAHFPGPQSRVSIKLRIDDGCAVFINGTEILPRQNLPPTGPILYDTPALAGVEATAYVTVQVPNGILIPGQENTIAVELHQNANTSSDAVFGFQLLETTAVGGETPTPFVENPEEWVELHNRSARAVSLAGWQLDGGVEFTFAPGAQLLPGAYLVVTRDPAAFQAAHPGVPAIGPFEGHLSHRGERLELKDALGSVVDACVLPRLETLASVRGRRWLFARTRATRTPTTRCRKHGRPAMKRVAQPGRSYSFTARAIQPVYAPNVFNFHELRLGLLEEGHVLIDDVAVIEDPSGTNRQLIQNGEFSAGTAATWRLLGNHESSQVVTDNGNPCLQADRGRTDAVHAQPARDDTQDRDQRGAGGQGSGVSNLVSRQVAARVPATPCRTVLQQMGANVPARAADPKAAPPAPAIRSTSRTSAPPSAMSRHSSGGPEDRTADHRLRGGRRSRRPRQCDASLSRRSGRHLSKRTDEPVG